MSAALIAQLKTMPTENIEKVLFVMVEKVQRIKYLFAMETDPEIRLAWLDKLKRIRTKYSHVEQELAIRLIIPKETVTALVDVPKLDGISDAIKASVAVIGEIGTL